MKFDHIGIATSDIDSLIAKLEGILKIESKSSIVYDELQDANLCMLTLEDGTKIELISGKVVENLVKKRNYLYHTCYQVDNIDAMVEKLVAKGAFVMGEKKQAKLFDNRYVIFLMWDLGIIELVEGEQ